MTTKETRALIEQFNEAWIKNDTAKVYSLLSDDVVWILPLGLRPPDTDRVVGREEIAQGLTCAPGSVPAAIIKRETMVRTVREVFVEGDSAVAFHHMTSEMVVGSQIYSNEYVWRYTCADGKVTQLVEHVDTLHAYKQNAKNPLFAGMLDS